MSAATTAAHLLGRSLFTLGVRRAFGVVGSGNFLLTRSFVKAGGTFVAARHEGGAATMADAYSRVSGEVAVVSVHQGCGYTNAITGIAEAAKSRTPLVVLAPQATVTTSNFYVEQAVIAAAVGAVPWPITSVESAGYELTQAVVHARDNRRTVVVTIPITVLDSPAPAMPTSTPPPVSKPLEPADDALSALARLIDDARRPVFIAGRGARNAKSELLALARTVGALTATSAVAAGLFSEEEWTLGVAGGFSSPAAAQLISRADLIIGWGCALNMWTMRHGTLINQDAQVAQVDDTAAALGIHRELDLAVHGDVAITASKLQNFVSHGVHDQAQVRYRTPEVAEALAQVRWVDVPYEDTSTEDRIDPRRLTIELNKILPQPRTVGIDSGNFMGYPAMYFDHVDEHALCFTQSFQSIGLGLATAIGAAIARPERLAVAALGDGGAAMGIAELETVARLRLPMLILVYNDSAYSAEVHHFSDENHSEVTFPEVDFAATAQGLGITGATVRKVSDLEAVRPWLAERNGPLLIDAKITADQAAWWLAEAFGH